MAQLAINGVPLPVMVDSLSVSHEEVGSKKRNARGWRVLDRRGVKRTFKFNLAFKPLDEAMMYRALLLGEGEHWTGASLYGDKGLALTGTGGVVGGACVDPYGLAGGWQAAQTGSQTMVLPPVGPDQSPVARAINAGGTKVAGRLGQTLIGWRGQGTAGTNAPSSWRVFGWSWRAWETPTVKREMAGALGVSGAAQAYGTAAGAAETFSTSAGALTVTVGGLSAGQAATYFSLWLLPWYFPQVQVDALMAGLASLYSPQHQLPGLTVTTDLLPDTQLDTLTAAGESELVCHGEVDSMTVKAGSPAGVFSKTLVALGCSLVEV